MWHGSGLKDSTRVAWIPLILLVTVSLIATILPNWKPVVDQVIRSQRIASFRNPDRARFAVSPWLKPFFKTADAIRPHLERGVPVMVGGRHRFFVAYRLRPRVCFLDNPRVENRLHQEGLAFVRIDHERRGAPRKFDFRLLFVDGFEDGHSSVWSVDSADPPEENR